MAENIRSIVLDSLIEILENGKFCNVVVNDTLRNYQYLEKKDRAFYTRLVTGTIEKMIYIDYVTDYFSKTKVKNMKPVIRSIMRMGVYQIIFMDSVPVSAACNEAVKLAKKRGFAGLAGFVNGVLRNVAREYKNVKLPDEDNIVRLYSVKYSMPEWIVDTWLSSYGNDLTVKMLESSDVKPNGDDNRHDITIRCLTDKEQLRKKLEADNITVKDGAYLYEALKISGVDNISRMEAFKNGEFYVQDESSMLVAHIAGVKEGDKVLDVCAAPGGKSFHIAHMLHGTGHVISRDLTNAKVDRIYENIERCGYNNIEAQLHDALRIDENLIGKMDVVIADLPCTGLGVVNRKPDIRYKTMKEDVATLSKLQRDILSVVEKYVKPGGTLIYSTCTVNDEENIDNAVWFSENFDFSMDSIDSFIPDVLKNDETKKGFLRLFPGEHSCDGFFITRFLKKL